MVRLAFAAINAATNADKEQQVGETREAQEARVADTYIQALQLLQDERTEEAQVCLALTGQLRLLRTAVEAW